MEYTLTTRDLYEGGLYDGEKITKRFSRLSVLSGCFQTGEEEDIKTYNVKHNSLGFVNSITRE